MMKPRQEQSVLILGGTRFVGRHITQKMIAAGYEITLFNRGTSNAELFPEMETLIGDRGVNNYAALKNRAFDIVIDTCAYIPRFVKEALNAVRCEHYIFISTISVYSDFSDANIDENSLLASTDGIADETVDGTTYGPQKVLCEQEATKHDCKLTILRPGLIVGPYDPTDRFSYWIYRTEFGGKMIAPGRPDDPIQFIDAADLASFVLSVAENQTQGTFNVVSTPGEFTIGELLRISKETTASNPELFWIENVEEFGLAPWADLPAWVSPNGDAKGLSSVSNRAAIERGLSISSLSETVESTWAQIQSEERRTQDELKAGLKVERENEILQKVGSR